MFEYGKPLNGACDTFKLSHQWGSPQFVPFCAYEKNPTNPGKCSCGTAGQTDLAVLLFLFVSANNRLGHSKWLKRFGVPDGI
jgi:hypothetical protein